MAATTIVFYGIRLEVPESDVTALESRTHPKILAAREVGLEYYWGNFDSPGEEYVMFIGKLIGKIGFEDHNELQFNVAMISEIAELVSGRLRQVGFVEKPCLHLKFQPD
ncbi:hypothetical protein [Blastopirellula marina]|uniref:Uncharacterized protein n=1 Tax=Blastopirellula marina TaxID=124 RepID=A0A2S8GBW1_9BACT|nr:hypothetical protein [Blastopirellula marina]PQO41927.1 hypothetical protein C5Y98_02500 [Blastopirellula marina]PTL46285.1 hypothetical protein C5Y97_02500 [Blastopirellula marina]